MAVILKNDTPHSSKATGSPFNCFKHPAPILQVIRVASRSEALQKRGARRRGRPGASGAPEGGPTAAAPREAAGAAGPREAGGVAADEVGDVARDGRMA